MPISNISREYCAKLMMDHCDSEHTRSIYGHVPDKIYGFTEGRLLFLCGRIIEMCRLDSEMWKKECERLPKELKQISECEKLITRLAAEGRIIELPEDQCLDLIKQWKR